MKQYIFMLLIVAHHTKSADNNPTTQRAIRDLQKEQQELNKRLINVEASLKKLTSPTANTTPSDKPCTPNTNKPQQSIFCISRAEEARLKTEKEEEEKKRREKAREERKKDLLKTMQARIALGYDPAIERKRYYDHVIHGTPYVWSARGPSSLEYYTPSATKWHCQD